MKRALLVAVYAAAIVVVLIGLGTIVAGVTGRQEVRDQLAREHVTGTPDMKPSAHPGAGVSCDVAGQRIDTGERARCFAQYMRLHALESTHEQTYAEMPRYVDAAGTPTDERSAAATDPQTGQPADNPARDVWVTETALSTALNMSFFAESVAWFSIAVGAALVVIGLLLLALIHRPPARTGRRAPARRTGARRT